MTRKTLRRGKSLTVALAVVSILISPLQVPTAQASHLPPGSPLCFDTTFTGGTSGWSTTGNWGSSTLGHTDSKSVKVTGNTNWFLSPDDDKLTKKFDGTDQADIELSYWFRADSLESSDRVYVEYSTNGSSWSEVPGDSRIENGEDDSAWYERTHTLPSSVDGDSSFWVRFRAHLSSSNDTVRLDDVSLCGTESTGFLTVTKILEGDWPEEVTVDDFSFEANSDEDSYELDEGESNELPSGIYEISEDADFDHFYTTTFGGDCDSEGNVTLGEDDELVCIITNTYQEFGDGDIVGHKFEDKNRNGIWDENEEGVDEWWIALARLGESEQPPCFSEECQTQVDSFFDIEIIAMDLTSDGGRFHFERPSGSQFVLLEETRSQVTQTTPDFQIDSFFDIAYDIAPPEQPQWNVDSFFDVFVEVEVQGPVTQGREPFNEGAEPQPLLFGNHFRSGGGSSQVTLVVKKFVVGDAPEWVYSDFSFVLTDLESDASTSYAFEGDGRNSFSLDPGEYQVIEEPRAGWIVSYDGDCDSNGVVTLNSGHLTCSVVNEWDPDRFGEDNIPVGGGTPENGTLIIEKVIVGGDAVYSDFSFTLDDTEYGFWEAGINAYEVLEGSHAVAELVHEGYFPWYSGDCDVDGNVFVPPSGVAICTITNTFSVGGFNGEDFTPPPSDPTPPQNSGGGLTVSNIGSSGDDGVSQDPLPPEPTDDGTATNSEDEMMASDSHAMTSAAISGSLSGLIPCSIGGAGWLIVNFVLLLVILLVWRDRRASHWLATILLVVVALGMNSWAMTCGLDMAWLPALLSLVTWLLLKLLGK